MTLREQLTTHVEKALVALYTQGFLAGDAPTIVLAPPKQASHGDYACTVALALAKSAGKKPRDIAVALQEALGNAGGLLEKTEIAGPGYLNLHVAPATWHKMLCTVLSEGKAFLRSSRGKQQKVLLEYVSANPTGPLHVAHGRGAVLGDVIANLMSTAGWSVEREYYVNDMGNQIDIMAQSVYLRYGELCGRPFTPPDDFYPGAYISDIAQQLHAKVGTDYLDKPTSVWLEPIKQVGVSAMRERIQTDLEAFGVRFDHFVSEKALGHKMDLQGMLANLEKAGHIYEEDGKKWFRSTSFGDDKDRVVVREDGRVTYFATDIAYHHNKLQRGFDRLINIWGADHGGYVTRVKAGMSALGHAGDPLHVILMQMVSLTRGGEAVRMGKRLGTAVWLREIIDEAGRDATRYFFLMRRADTQMDFDIDLATKKSLDNPVFYAQMGYARLASIARRARDEHVPEPVASLAALAPLGLPEEFDLIKALVRAPDVVADAAEAAEPHLVVNYVQNLIAQFHSYYTQYKNTERVISQDSAKTQARLLLCQGLAEVLHDLLDLLGVAAPERMSLPAEAT